MVCSRDRVAATVELARKTMKHWNRRFIQWQVNNLGEARSTEFTWTAMTETTLFGVKVFFFFFSLDQIGVALTTNHHNVIGFVFLAYIRLTASL